jgi:hypothetical protein
MVREEGGPLLEEAPRLLELGVDKGGLNINQSYVVEKTSAIMGSFVEESSLEYDRGGIMQMQRARFPNPANPRHKPYPLLPSLLPHLGTRKQFGLWRPR